MARRPHFLLLSIVVTFAAGMLSGSCRGPSDVTEELTPIRVTLSTVGTPISTLVIEVTAADIRNRLVFNIEVVGVVATGTIDVPAGVARTFTVTAFDNQNNVTHEGSETTDVSPGRNPPLRIKLKPIVGQVEVTVTFGTFSVLVAPAAAIIDAAISNQLQLAVTVIGVDGLPVQNPLVQWATTHPTLAAVSASGLVTGLADGSATIVATFEGIAGLSDLTLTGFGGTTPFTVGGNVTGLTGAGLVLQNNGADDLAITANGVFTFATALTDRSAYAVTVLVQPTAPGQVCVVTNDSGTIAGANVTNVSVVCVTSPPSTFTVGGNVTGLTGAGLILQNNGIDDLVVTANGLFTFTATRDGSGYIVTVLVQPTGQVCVVTNGAGTIAGANVENVSVVCVTSPPSTFTVGGNVTGLTSSGVILQNNFADDLAITANGVFTFATALTDGSAYNVTVETPPIGHTCGVTMETSAGTISSANVTNVSVVCVAFDVTLTNPRAENFRTTGCAPANSCFDFTVFVSGFFPGATQVFQSLGPCPLFFPADADGPFFAGRNLDFINTVSFNATPTSVTICTWVDPKNVIAEIDETNNKLEVDIALPSLTITRQAFVFPGPPPRR